MAEPKVAATYANRRLQTRFFLGADFGAVLSFCYPTPHGPRLQARIRDISLSGLSMVLPEELSGIDVGEIIKGLEARVEKKRFRGDLLVMHVTPAGGSAAICGGLFYPEGDEDLITIRLVVRALEASSPVS